MKIIQFLCSLLRIFVLMGLIISFSGCIGFKEDLVKHSVRKASDSEHAELITHIENYDLLNFVKLELNDSNMFQGFDVNQFYNAHFVRNISLFLIDAEEYYYRKTDLTRGSLRYHITGQDITDVNYLEILPLSEKLRNTDYYFGPKPRYGDFVAYNDTKQVKHEVIITRSELELLIEQQNHSKWVWMVLAEFNLNVDDWAGGCQGYGFGELFILDHELRLQFFLSASEFPVC